MAWDTTYPDGQPRRALDTTRAERAFGFRARTPFEEGLRRTVDWFERARTADVASETAP
jgi:GDP-L-fucose synthase